MVSTEVLTSRLCMITVEILQVLQVHASFGLGERCINGNVADID
jgi:hypothetical protein